MSCLRSLARSSHLLESHKLHGYEANLPPRCDIFTAAIRAFRLADRVDTLILFDQIVVFGAVSTVIHLV